MHEVSWECDFGFFNCWKYLHINTSLYVINIIQYEKKIKQLCENVKPVLFR